MITLNGKKFARTNKEFTESLFCPGGTCAGFYEVKKCMVVLTDMQRNRIGVITCHGVLCNAVKWPEGGYWYNYAAPRIIGEWESYSQERDEIKAVVNEHLSAVSVPSASL